MKINEKILSIPPYISTTWAHISALMMKGTQLSVTLNDGDTVNVPGLEKEVIDLIFKTHAEQIEKNCFHELSMKMMKQDRDNKQLSMLSQNIFGIHESESAMGFGFATLDGFNTIMQHDPQGMNAPDLPNVLIERIESIAKMMSPEETTHLPKEVPNCNCFHCQITKTLNHNVEKPQGFIQELDLESIDFTEELVSDDDLQFSQWDIASTEENLFTVTNKLDLLEQYTVFLGDPVGCNCGQPNCEHIIAVLRA